MLQVENSEKPLTHVLWSESEITTCRSAWEEFQNHPNADWEFFDLINRFRKEIESPCILELKSGGEIQSLWAARLERGRMPLRLGYLDFGSIVTRSLSIITGGVMGDDSERACRLLLERAMRLLNEMRLDFVTLSYLPCEHPLFGLAAREAPKWHCRDWGISPSIHLTMSLPATFDQFLQQRGKKHRYWLKRLPRVLDQAFPGQVKIRRFTEPGSVDEFCRDAEAVSKLTYQHQLGESLRASPEHLARCHLLAEQGALRGYILYLKDKPRAYWLATAWKDTLHLNLTGYVPEFRDYELGTILMMKVFEDHCGQNTKKIDFGHGGAVYKERFADERFHEASVRIYRASPRALAINAFTSCNQRASKTIKALLTKLGILQKIKTLWRARLSNS